MEDLYLVRSLDRDSLSGLACFWKSGRQGYTYDINEAGKYTKADAEAILKSANLVGVHEEMYSLDEVRYAAQYNVYVNELPR